MTDSGTIDFEQGQSNSELTDEQKIDYIVDNWDEIAALMEQGARTKQLNDELKTYIGDVKSELSCLLYTSPSPRDATLSRMPSSA